jgi:hypothetical protein
VSDDPSDLVDEAAKTFGEVGAGTAGFATAYHLLRKKPPRDEPGPRPSDRAAPSGVWTPSGRDQFPSSEQAKSYRLLKLRNAAHLRYRDLRRMLRAHPRQALRVLRTVAATVLRRLS